ncbi:MAG: acyl--CoA ligase [Lachnospiraceae bacterium]|nr:acyl--CoA ligase [Lachnospiraceae bacterium]
MRGTAAERRRELDSIYPVWERHTTWGRFVINVARFRERVFITTDEGDFTYIEIASRAIQASETLALAGVVQGMHVGIHLCNNIDFVVMTYALSILGAVSVLLNPKAPSSHVAELSEQAGVKILLTKEEEILQSPLMGEKGIKVIDPRKIMENRSAGRERTESQNSENRLVTIETDPDRTAVIIFTSGSTSRPKCVTLTHDALLRSSFGTCRTRCMEDGRRILLPIPLFHAMGYVEGLLPVVYVGGSVVITEKKFDPGRILEDLKKFQCNDLVCVSLVAMRLLEEQKKRRELLPDLHAAYWASSCPDHVWEEAAEAFGIDDITTAYGMTECGSTSVMMRPEDPLPLLKRCHGVVKEAGCAGIPEEDGRLLQTRIRDPETGEELSAGRAGVLYCKGPCVTKGYYNDAAATAKAIDADGWFCTNDICVLDEKGYLTFLGRSDDVYKINGENVAPALIDSVIEEWPGVVETAVVGIPDDKYGFVGVAFVELTFPEQADAALRSYCADKLLHYQIPKYFIYVRGDQWIRTSNNKVIKAKMKKLAEEVIRRNPSKESIFLYREK